MIENSKAQVGEIGTDYAGKWLVYLDMTDKGEDAWHVFTAAHIDEQAAIILDNKVYFAPYY